MYDFDHQLFLALNFRRRPRSGPSLLIVSGTTMWLPLYALILWLVWRRDGWRNVIVFTVLMVAALVLSDMVSGIFKHNGVLGGLLPTSNRAGGRCSPPRSKGWRSPPTR